jgi:hypothetical protein
VHVKADEGEVILISIVFGRLKGVCLCVAGWGWGVKSLLPSYWSVLEE